MSKSQETFSKKEKEKKRQKKRKEKEQKKEDRKANSQGARSFEDMLAYVDENGRLTSTPPDPSKKRVINAEDIEIGVARRADVDPIHQGNVTFFNTEKGYGFIKDKESGESIFVHINGLIDSIKENDKVTFETEMGPKGTNAVRVRLAPKVETPKPEAPKTEASKTEAPKEAPKSE
ncbi:MAG: cold shock domain-containing protein [Bacteroidetes bacterium]|jgi:cold shock CspA family protein|nr:cold shock domain-containing protein [Bacteroidota bacterium]MBP6401615.1 cold shock domain-containing protein [Bacteroidia bacterium]MBK9526456.1 cold shock domain-containing protein [Bacteroidota bacterium]MBK9543968.1 cold shock domain-containing protein [Bacteroidota bacterium]MBL0256562.1 cold shock domain-containing protein [Bacteroidota bacterium]